MQRHLETSQGIEVAEEVVALTVVVGLVVHTIIEEVMVMAMFREVVAEVFLAVLPRVNYAVFYRCSRVAALRPLWNELFLLLCFVMIVHVILLLQ